MEAIQVKMLGSFSMSCGENRIIDSDSRSKKVWMLLAYIVCHRDRVVTQEELFDLLWGEDAGGGVSSGTLKTTMHRVRALLDHLYPEAGHQMVLNRNGGYVWNNEVDAEFDTDLFDTLCKADYATEEMQLNAYLKALDLYQGEFMERFSTESWVLPITAYFHEQYIKTLLKTLPMLAVSGKKAEICRLCHFALAIEPYHEEIYRYLMRALIEQGNRKEATAEYEKLSQRLLSDFGIMPEEETRNVYREATRTLNEKPVPLDVVWEQLREETANSGALFCEYDFFRILCHSAARAMVRSSIPTQVALMSVVSEETQGLSKRSMYRAIENLEEQIRVNLRRGDTFARCSGSQYVLMLPQADYINGCKVCERIIRAYVKRYPHSLAKIEYEVKSIDPSL